MLGCLINFAFWSGPRSPPHQMSTEESEEVRIFMTHYWALAWGNYKLPNIEPKVQMRFWRSTLFSLWEEKAEKATGYRKNPQKRYNSGMGTGQDMDTGKFLIANRKQVVKISNLSHLSQKSFIFFWIFLDFLAYSVPFGQLWHFWDKLIKLFFIYSSKI